MLKRLNNWPEAFAAALEAVQHEPFEWGKNDCCLFACNIVKAITGTDLASPFRGYKDRAEAFEIIKGYGGIGKLAESVAEEYGIPEINPLIARRGDVCLFNNGNGETLGICRGDLVLAPGKEKLDGIPVSKVSDTLRAWRIG
ncbi:MAG: hypothetical protein H6867_04770 [Rhodospirillales bacterium]|nr:hypothetical protein [Rhodospirillales bacterium]MCB9994814.1 hypothetical protein [Rhodospirillales bacterium]